MNAVQAARKRTTRATLNVSTRSFHPAGSRGLRSLSERAFYSSTGWILDGVHAEAAAFSSAYEAEFGHAPDWWSELGYTAAQQLIAAIEAAGTIEYEEVAPLMNDEHGFITPRGKPLRFNDKGLRLVDDWIIIQSQGGVLLPVDAVPIAG